VLVAFWIGFEGIGLDLHDFVFDWGLLMVFEVIVHFLLKLQGELAEVCFFPQVAVFLHIKLTFLLFSLCFSFIC
jgi:hypothetical protein